MTRRGELEQRVMELLWEADAPRTVADVQAELGQERQLAYTTVMTVLDRLAKKGLVSRQLVDRAWRYQPSDPRATVMAREMAELLAGAPADVRLAALRELASRLEPGERAALRTI